MGQKTHPYGFRLVYNKNWHSRWYAEGKQYADTLKEDLELRQQLKKRLFEEGASVFDSKPVGRRAQDAPEKRIEALEAKLQEKNEVLAELMGEHVQLKKTLGRI